MSCQTTDKHNKFNDSNISSQKMIRHEIRKFARVLSCQTADKNNILKKSYSLHKIAPGYSEQTIPLKNKYPNSHLVTLSKPFHKKTRHKIAPGYSEQTLPQKNKHYTNLRLVTASKLFHKKTLQKIASGYSEERLPQTHTTQTGTWLLWANRSTKTLHQNCIWLFWAALPQTNPYTNWHLATLSKSFHKKVLLSVLQKDPTQHCTWWLTPNPSTQKHYANLHLVTLSKLFHKNTLHEIAPGCSEQTLPRRRTTTQTYTWLLQTNRYSIIDWAWCAWWSSYWKLEFIDLDNLEQGDLFGHKHQVNTIPKINPQRFPKQNKKTTNPKQTQNRSHNK